MSIITTTRDLESRCRQWQQAEYITVDTEFVRTRTYYAQLCLVQISDGGEAIAIDALAKGIDLKPLYELLNNEKVIKVFHAARQDLEIFYHEGGVIPHPLFDTQIAAMVCGFGEQAGYETLVKAIAKKSIDKSQRFTDWAKRPLSARQIEYALSDVTHLRRVYEFLRDKIKQSGRLSWVDEEMRVLTSPGTYENHPEEAWQRLKVKSTNPRFLAQVQALAGLRETEAQEKDVPRNRIMDDKTLLQLAAHAPHSEQELKATASRAWFLKDKKLCGRILDLVKKTEALPREQLPDKPKRLEFSRAPEGTMELLKVLLKHQCQEAGVATKLVATSRILEEFAKGNGEDAPFLKGWRYDLFGKYAKDLVEGRLGLAIGPRGLTISKTAK